MLCAFAQTRVGRFIIPLCNQGHLMTGPDKTMLHYSIDGPSDGTTVLFLHAVGIDATMWRLFLHLLPGVRAVLIDLPGHGNSRDIPWVSLEHTADQVADIANAVAPDKAHLAAISLGSYVGLAAISAHPNTFRSALLSGMHAGAMPHRRLMHVLSAVMAPIATRHYFARKTATMFGAQGAEIEDFARGARRTRTRAFRRATNDVVRFGLPEGLDHVQARCLFMAGARENATILDALPILSDSVPHGSTQVVDGGGHGWPGAQRETFADALLYNIRDEDAQ